MLSLQNEGIDLIDIVLQEIAPFDSRAESDNEVEESLPEVVTTEDGSTNKMLGSLRNVFDQFLSNDTGTVDTVRKKSTAIKELLGEGDSLVTEQDMDNDQVSPETLVELVRKTS